MNDPHRPRAAAATQARAGRPQRRRGRRSVAVHGIDPVDVHVGSRLRERRVSLGMSQTVLAERLGLTFQQVQKYERGTNRLSASTLWRAADAVDVPISYFYDGLRQGRPIPGGDELDVVVLKLTQKMRKLEPAVREKLSALIATLARDPA